MYAAFHISGTYLLFLGLASVFAIAYPLVLAAVTHRRLGVRWKIFAYGALIFFLSQLISRIPAVAVIGALLSNWLKASQSHVIIWLIALAISAGLFEEIGRYIGYTWLMGTQEKTWSTAIMYGLGHGGLESIALVGLSQLATLANLVILSSQSLNTLPDNQRALAMSQLAAIAAQPVWIPLLGAWERLWTIPLQVCFSVIVLQVFRRDIMHWLWIAVAAHALVDGVAVILPQAIGPGQIRTFLVIEGIVALFGIVAIWVIFRLRDDPLPRARAGVAS